MWFKKNKKKENTCKHDYEMIGGKGTPSKAFKCKKCNEVYIHSPAVMAHSAIARYFDDEDS